MLVARRWSAALLGAVGLVVFGISSLACGLVDDLDTLLWLRAVQAVGGAAGARGRVRPARRGLARPGRRLWVAASVFGTATGPALGGVLTDLFDWRAIFLVQLPIVVPGAIACIAAAFREGPLASSEGGDRGGAVLAPAGPPPHRTRPASRPP